MLKVYNTLSQQKEIFKPRKGKKLKLFVCGPTVYDSAHIGHARTYIIFDVIAKYLKQKGYNVFYLQNITDIDDKIIKRAKEKGISPQKLSRDFEKEYLKDMKNLKIDSVTKYARATEFIKEIISQVKRLLEKDYAYQIEDGIYYDISKFRDYGKLSKRTVLQAEDAVSRIDDSKGKKNKGDFCLWKYAKSPSELRARSMRKGTCEYEPSWPSPFGRGRPGWHIEDTAITEKYFGPQYDIHGGAIELSFPHHEAEIAQMEAVSEKKPLVKYWLHTGLLTIGGVKMAKSLGNFITIKNFLKSGPRTKGMGAARILRFFILKSHYRSPIDYNESAIVQAKKELARIDEFIDKIQIPRPKGARLAQRSWVAKFQKEFEAAMSDDFNTPRALAVIFNLITKGNSLIAKNKLSSTDAKEILNFLKKIDEVFGFIFWKKPKEKIPQEILKLVKEREKYRKVGLWQKADDLRKKAKEMGYWIEDTKDGPKIKKI